MHEKGAHFFPMHSTEALDRPIRVHEEENAPLRAHLRLHAVRRVKYVQYFVGTTC